MFIKFDKLGALNFRRAGKMRIFYCAKTHERKLYSLCSPHDNCHILQDGWCIIIIAIYDYLFTYVRLLGKAKAYDSDYPRIHKMW